MRFRKSGEAFLKIIIYENKGDALGHQVIIGATDVNGVPSPKVSPMMYRGMLQLCKQKGWIDRTTNTLLNDLKNKVNEDAHDPNTAVNHSDLADKLEECFDLSEKLTNALYAKTGRSVPAEFKQAYADGLVDPQLLSSIVMDDIDSFVEHVEDFDRSNRYVLVAPFSMRDISDQLMRNLMGVRWSVVIDFDCKSKEAGGLYHAMQPEIEDNCTPFTILNRDNLNNMSRGTNGNVNWIFANGLSALRGTVSNNIKEWIAQKAHHFLKDALTEFCKKSQSHIHIISLLEDDDYLAEVIRLFDGIDFAERDLVSFSIVSDNPIVRDNSLKLSRYGFDIKCFSFSRMSLLSEIGDFLQPDDRHTILVPGRDVNNKNTWVDLTSLYSILASNGITVVHKDVGAESDSEIETIPAFYKGETITWKELGADIDVQRGKYDELQKKILDRLAGRHSQKFLLYHMAGAGGTTISRRLAFNLKDRVPTIIIKDYNKSTTFHWIETISMKVNLPMLAIVESSKVGNIDDLIAECNANKRIVLFVYVERVLKRPSVIGQPLVEFITDKMINSDEKDKFQYKVQLYNPNSSGLQWIKQNPYASCEVLDFSMSIAEKSYHRSALKSYIKNYLNQLSEPVAEFLVFVSLIYHYSQRSVPDLVFRKIFKTTNGKTGLMQYMRQRQQELVFLRKLVTDNNNDQSEDKLWRPRYFIFADIILEELLGGANPDQWRNALPEWSRKLITTVKDNCEYLADEVRKMMVAMFLERENEDLLGHEEVWNARGAQDKFSHLLDDMNFSIDDQKSILKLLATSFPSVAHFWGHLARFCYENADTPAEFSEAVTYIEKALDKSGTNDYNLLHIAGMCQRRLLEYYKRHNEDIGREELKRLTEAARNYFHKSREVNPKNIHAYMSEIQLLSIVIEYGKAFSTYEKFNTFLVAHENGWFFAIYQDLNDLVDEVSLLLNQISTLGTTNRVLRTRSMLAHSESKMWEYVGDYKESLRTLKEHINNADRLSLPRLRLMYVRTLLLSKVRGNHEHLMEAWPKLDDKELALVEDYLAKNVQQSSDNVNSMRLWMQYVRYAGMDVPIEDVKSRLKMLFKNSDNYPMTKLEAAFNLYILNLFELIQANDALNNRKQDEIRKWIEECRKLSSSDKYPFEWLVSLDDISGIVNTKFKPEFSQFVRINGTIADIKSNAQGTIRLDCGFDVFFTPSVGCFIQGKDETSRVSLVLAFRHEGPAAYEVQRLDGVKVPESISRESELVQDLEITDVEAIEPVVKEAVTLKSEVALPHAQAPHLKIVGKIDLGALEEYNKPRRKKN